MATHDRWDDFKIWADERLLSNAYTAISVSTRRFRTHLRESGRIFMDPNSPESCSLLEADGTADWVVEQVSVQKKVLKQHAYSKSSF